MSRFVLAQLARSKDFFSKFLPKKLTRYHYGAFFVFLLLSFFLLSTKVAHAGLVESFVEAVASMFLAFAKVAMAFTIFFLRYFITLASYNDYINVSVVKLGWVMVRDVANMFFVVSLLVIAFATILGVEKYEWKKGLVKLVIMAILINFSNLIAQVIIDAAHVFTITFLNAISASAGGNLINMFSMDKITSIVQGKSIGENIETATASIFAASVVALLFAVGTTIAIGSYVVVMALRIVVLWALIILSPLAYLFSALPGGEKYSSKWWSEFTNHVVVAPVMVFFLWLAFATLGSGQIMTEIQAGSTIPLQQSSDSLSVSLTDVSTWENMSNYILALVFLLIGLKMTQETGATASGMVGAAEKFVKNVATIASGYAAGRWLVGKGVDNGKSLLTKGALGTLKRLPVIGGNQWKKRGYRIASWYQRGQDKRDQRAQGLDDNYRKIKELKMKSRIGSDEDKQKARDELAKYSKFDRLKAGVGRAVAAAYQTSGRTDKEIEDHKETYDRTKKWRELRYSTSKLGGGIAKQEITGKLQIQEKISESKKTQKGEDMFRRLTEETSPLTKKEMTGKGRDRFTAEELAAGKVSRLGRDLSENIKKDELAKSKNESSQGMSKQQFASTEMGKNLDTSKAVLQNIQEEMSKKGRFREAQARAAAYEGAGDSFKAEQVMKVAYQEIEEENAKKFKSLSRGERSVSAAKLMTDIGSATDPDKKRMLQRDLMSLLQFIETKGADDMASAREAMIDKLYAGVPGGADLSLVNEGKLLLEFMGGKRISNAGEFDAADVEFGKLFTEGGPAQKNAVLSNWANTARWSSLETGGVAPAAAIEEDDSSGRREYKIFNPYIPTRKNKQGAVITKEEAASNTFGGVVKYVNTKSLNNLDFLSETRRENGETFITGFSLPKQKQLFIDLMTQFSDERAVADGFNPSFSGSIKTTSFDSSPAGTVAKGEFIDAMHQVMEKYKSMGIEEVGKVLMQTQYSDFINDIKSGDGNPSQVAELKAFLVT